MSLIGESPSHPLDALGHDRCAGHGAGARRARDRATVGAEARTRSRRAASTAGRHAPRVAVLSRGARCSDGAELDQSIVIRYDAPASFTGEDAVEIITHGGLVVPTTVDRRADRARRTAGARRRVHAARGAQRQARHSAGRSDGRSRRTRTRAPRRRAALRQLDGGLSRRVLALRDELIGLEALIAYDIDFPEEDDGPIAPARIDAPRSSVIACARAAARDRARRASWFARGRSSCSPERRTSASRRCSTRCSARVERSSPRFPGTTRDAIEAVIDTPTLPLRLVDTAGMRDALDPVERIGVEVSASYVARAAVVLACGDSIESRSSARDGAWRREPARR